MKYLFIDGNNLGIRASFANKDLSVDFMDYSADFNPDEVGKIGKRLPTGSIHGFFRSLKSVRLSFPDRYICVVWDGKSKARILESREAVAKGIVPQGYKENRPKTNKSDAYVDFHVQKPIIMEALSLTNVPQVTKPDEESDDVIASFVSALPSDDIVILTNDKDYYQLIRPGVKILDASGSLLDEEWFKKGFGISPPQWVDVGALQGDSGDNIFGIPWVGEGTAIKEIAKYGTCEAVLASYESEYSGLRATYPDVSGQEFAELKTFATANKNQKFPHIKEWMPYTGVALAYEKGKVKIPRSVVMTLVYQSRIPLAKNLKAMRTRIPLPKLPVDLGREKTSEFVRLCEKYSLTSTALSASILCSRQVTD